MSHKMVNASTLQRNRMPTFQAHKLTIILPFLIPDKPILCRCSLHRRNFQHSPFFLQTLQTSVHRCPSDPDLFPTKDLHKLVNRIKRISIFLQTLQDQLLLPGTVFHFFFHIVHSLPSTAPSITNFFIVCIFIHSFMAGQSSIRQADIRNPLRYLLDLVKSI